MTPNRREYRRKLRQEIRKFLVKLKHKTGCIRCGSHKQLEFHHIDPTTKRESVAHMIGHNRTRATIMREVEKCEVVCRECHSEIHNG